MAKNQQDVLDSKDFREIIKSLTDGPDGLSATDLYNAIGSEQNDEFVTKSLKSLGETIAAIRIKTQQVNAQKTVQEKNDYALLKEVLIERLNQFSKNPDWGTDYGDYVSANIKDFLDDIMDLKIPKNASKTIEELLNNKDANAAARIRKNKDLEGVAANFMLSLFVQECNLNNDLAKLSDPKGLDKIITNIKKAHQEVVKLEGEAETLHAKLEIELQIKLTSPRTEQDNVILQQSMEQSKAIQKALKNLKVNIQYLRGGAEQELNRYKRQLDIDEEYFNKVSKYEPEQKMKYLEQATALLGRAKNDLVVTKRNLEHYALELPKSLNDIKDQSNQNLKKLAELSKHVALSKENKEQEDLLKQIEMLKKEMEALQKENQNLKQENQALKKTGASASTTPVQKTNAGQVAQPVSSATQAKPPALPPTPKSPIATRAATPPPIPSASAAVKPPVLPRAVTPPPVPSSTPKPVAAATAKPTTPPPAKPAGAAVGATATPKASPPPPAALTIAQQIAKNKADRAKAEEASKPIQNVASKSQPPRK